MRDLHGQVTSLWSVGSNLDPSAVVMDATSGFKLYDQELDFPDGGWMFEWSAAGFDPRSGPTTWSLPWIGGRWFNSVLTNRSTLLVNHGAPDGGELLGEIDASGNPLYECPLGTAMSLMGSRPLAALTNSRWTEMVTWSDGGARLESFAVPGLAEAASGWTTQGGNMARNGVPR